MSEFIQWISADEFGAFSHIGQQLSRKDGMITMLLNGGGTVTFAEDDGVVESAKKPANWGEVVVAAEPEKKAVTRTRNGGPSKKEQALQIYRDLAGKGHGKDMTIQRFMDVLGMSKAGATTYFYTCKKEA